MAATLRRSPTAARGSSPTRPLSIIAGLTALAWTTLRVPISPTIDPALNGTALAGPSGGMLLWIAYGMIGSLRVLPAPGGHSVWTFHFPFVAAAMVLGGPTAGAWVAFVSTIERRELDEVPWYGTLANHSVMAFAAVVGGLTAQVVNGALLTTSASAGVAGLVAVTGGTLVLAAVLILGTAGTIMLREGLSAGSLLETLIGFVGRLTVGEVVLAWVFTISYTAVGWWAPMALALTTLVLWPVDTEGPDSLTHLPRLRRFEQLPRWGHRPDPPWTGTRWRARRHRPRQLRSDQQGPGAGPGHRRRGARRDRASPPQPGPDRRRRRATRRGRVRGLLRRHASTRNRPSDWANGC